MFLRQRLNRVEMVEAENKPGQTVEAHCKQAPRYKCSQQVLAGKISFDRYARHEIGDDLSGFF